MADNTELNAGSGGDVLATDDIGGVKFPRTKLVIGADGTNDGDVASGNPLPVLARGAADDDAAASGNPLLIGGSAHRGRRTAVSADGDAVRLSADRYGRLQMSGIDLSVAAVQATSSGDTALVAAAGSGDRIKVLRVEASNSHAATPLTVGLKTAAIFSGGVFGKRYLPALGGAAVWNFPGGHVMCGDNEALNVNLSAGGQIEMTVYYEIVAS